MKREFFSISFVGVMKNPFRQLPNFNNEFARNLFGKPYDTFNGFTPDGYVIAIENKPFPMVVFNPAKLIIKAKTKEELVKYLETISPELAKYGINTEFMSFGINSEYQWTEITENAEKWMWDHFMNANLAKSSQFQMCNNLKLRFGLNETQYANIDIEPRKGIRDGIFASINHHHNQMLSGIPTGKAAMDLITNSIETIENIVLKDLVENEQ